jgi:hypothetical protein
MGRLYSGHVRHLNRKMIKSDTDAAAQIFQERFGPSLSGRTRFPIFVSYGLLPRCLKAWLPRLKLGGPVLLTERDQTANFGIGARFGKGALAGLHAEHASRDGDLAGVVILNERGKKADLYSGLGCAVRPSR